jgi:1-deoxy-D-xylulose-5-phosphate synthase
MDIDKITSPDILKNKKQGELCQIAESIRQEIIKQTSIYGGHLSSNLGVVELTMSLHRKFDFNVDRILFDVSHQTYTHKILTGRTLHGLRTTTGISGFSKRQESSLDHFEAGHAGTSLSTAYGMAIARDLNKQKHHIVAVIGDASIANGMSFEALNAIGHSKHKVIIVLNDNEMSIAYPVGSVSRFLKRVRFSPTYLKNKEAYRRMMFKTKFGYTIFRYTQHLKNVMFRYISPSNLFEQMGFGYIGPINGHSFKSLEKALSQAKRSGLSVIVHVKTVKGRGYRYAETDTSGYWHGVTPFDINTGEPKVKHPELMSWSHLYSDLLSMHMENNDDVVVVNPATTKGSGLEQIFSKYPHRTFDVGIAEEHALTTAAGLALAGKRPIISIYSTFLQRAIDQLSHDIARQELDVTLLIDRAGLVGADGDTHQGIYDESYLLATPNITLAMASDACEAKGLLDESLIHKGPFAIRYPRDYLPIVCEIETRKTPLGQWRVFNESKSNHVALISLGPILHKIMALLRQANIDITVFNAIYQKPLDYQVIDALLKYQNIVIHNAYATSFGFANYLSYELNKRGYQGNIIIRAIDDAFVKHATISEQMETNQVAERQIVDLIASLNK